MDSMSIDMPINTLSALLLLSNEKEEVVKSTLISFLVVTVCWYNSFTKYESVLEKPLNHNLKFPSEIYFEVLSNLFLQITNLTVKNCSRPNGLYYAITRWTDKLLLSILFSI